LFLNIISTCHFHFICNKGVPSGNRKSDCSAKNDKENRKVVIVVHDV
jgi:hypothetical protein